MLMHIIDETDQRLIAALRRDGRASVSELAQRLGLARATVRARIERLMARGEISGFTVLTRADLAESPVRCMMMIGMDGCGADRAVSDLLGMAEVQSVHATSGKWDLMVELGVQTLGDLDRVMAQIKRIAGVTSSESNLLLSTRRAGK